MKQSVSTPAAARKTIKNVQDLPYFIPPFHPDLYLTQKCSYSNEDDGSVMSRFYYTTDHFPIPLCCRHGSCTLLLLIIKHFLNKTHMK